MTSKATSTEAPTDSGDTEAYQQAIQLLHACSTEDGFLASRTERDNYRRVWARDGVIVGLAALMSQDQDLIVTLCLCHNSIFSEIGRDALFNLVCQQTYPKVACW